MKLRTKFKDDDFKLGEVVDASIMYGYGDTIEVCCGEKMKHRKYNSIKDFTDHWEDYEEPKVYYYISDFGAIRECEIGKFPEDEENRKQIGNYFETKEEAEKAVEKLKAWKRLKDKGFRFHDWKEAPTYCLPYDWDECVELHEIDEDLDLLFGGKE